MIKLVTPNQLKDLANVAMPVDEYFEEIDFSQLLEAQVMEIIRRIDGVDYLRELNRIESKFEYPKHLPLSDLSTGCKTALVILYFGHYADSEINVVDISECGENALDVCLELLNNSKVSGMVYTFLNSTNDFRKLDITANGVQVDNLYLATGILNKEVGTDWKD
jgi:hypothetical protein